MLHDDVVAWMQQVRKAVLCKSLLESSFPCHLFFEKSGRVSRCTSDSYKPFIRATPEPLSLTPCVSLYKES